MYGALPGRALHLVVCRNAGLLHAASAALAPRVLGKRLVAGFTIAGLGTAAKFADALVQEIAQQFHKTGSMRRRGFVGALHECNPPRHTSF